MSVVKGKRGENKLKVLDYAGTAVVETIRYCKQEKSFPKRERWILAMPITLLCVAACVCIKMANARYIEQTTEGGKAELQARDMTFRIDLEKTAHSCYVAQLGLIDIAYRAHEKLDAHTIEVWTGYILEADNALLDWIKSEKERMKKLG